MDALSKLEENNINIERKGGQWLYVLLDEKSSYPGKKLSPKAFYRSLCRPEQTEEEIEKGYKSMMGQMQKELDIALPKKISVTKFINEEND